MKRLTWIIAGVVALVVLAVGGYVALSDARSTDASRESADETAIRQVALDSLPKRDRSNLRVGESVVIDEVAPSSTDSWSWVGGHVTTTQPLAYPDQGSEGLVIIMRRVDGDWVPIFPNDPNYIEAVRDAPDSVLSEADKHYLIGWGE